MMIMESDQKLILIDVDHEVLIMKEGVGWLTTDTCKR
jgi:hypothetical protein